MRCVFLFVLNTCAVCVRTADRLSDAVMNANTFLFDCRTAMKEMSASSYVSRNICVCSSYTRRPVVEITKRILGLVSLLNLCCARTRDIAISIIAVPRGSGTSIDPTYLALISIPDSYAARSCAVGSQFAPPNSPLPIIEKSGSGSGALEAERDDTMLAFVCGRMGFRKDPWSWAIILPDGTRHECCVSLVYDPLKLGQSIQLSHSCTARKVPQRDQHVSFILCCNRDVAKWG
eukprot:m.40111 g.40111  ORF g.40111 m.40111 type:complete len:233 (-) comp14782_c0_seq5:299-997(-)